MHASRDRGREKGKEKRVPFDIGDDTEYVCIASIFSYVFFLSLRGCERSEGREGGNG